jgi:Terminase large subunit, T4likevirus-type, N-terminal
MLFGQEGITGAAELLYRVDALRFARERLGFSPDAKQAAVMSGKIRRGLLNCTRQWGKSTITAAMAVHRAWTVPESLTIAVSPSGRQTGEFLRKASGFVRKLGIRVRGDRDNEISLLFPNGARVVGLPGSESTVRGFSAVSLMLIDEAARVRDDLYKAVRPFLAASDGDLWLMSTPVGKRGFFYEEWANGGPRWKRFTVTAADCSRIGREFLEEERETMGEQWFRQEYMCEFVDVDQGLFSRDVVERAFSKDVRPMLFGHE